MTEEKRYHKVKIVHGSSGWGGPLVIEPKPGRDVIYSVTGGGIHPIAKLIADLTGGVAFDGFRSSAPLDSVACVVIDCGGTARVGVYPMKKIPTVDVIGTKPAGPLFRFITSDIFVSGCRAQDITVVE